MARLALGRVLIEAGDIGRAERECDDVLRLAIAEDAERPQWTPDGLEEVRRLTRQGR